MNPEKFAVLYQFPDPPLEQAWRDCLAAGDMPTHFAAPEYFLEPSTKDEQRFAVLALDTKSDILRITGVITGVVKDGTVVSGQIGTPQICVEKSADCQSVLRALTEGLGVVGKRAGLIEVFSWFPVEALRELHYSETETTGSAALDLRAGSEKIFKKLKGRSQIRHAISAGVLVREATKDDLPAYYEILRGWSAQKGLSCPSFEIVQASFGLSRNRRLFVATYEGKVIAGTPVRFYTGATAEYAWNASLPEFQHLRPNDLLHWRIIEWACGEGMHTYLLGATHTFSLKYSDRVMPTYKYSRDLTFLRRHTLKSNLMDKFYGLYRSLPPGVKERVKRLRG